MNTSKKAKYNTIIQAASGVLILGSVGQFLFFTGLISQLNLSFTVMLLIALSLIVSALSIMIDKEKIQHLLWVHLILLLSPLFLLELPRVILPEISFDALWYHLPLARIYATTHTLLPVSHIPYSTISRLGSLYYSWGFLLNSPLTVKLISFLFASLLAIASYFLARTRLSPHLSLLVGLLVSTNHIVGWQSTAGYADLIKSLFEVSALCLVLLPVSIPSSFMIGGLMGMAFATKFQAIYLSLGIVFYYLLTRARRQQIIWIALAWSLTVMPHLAFNTLYTHHPFYPLNQASKQIDQLQHASGTSDMLSHILIRISTFPKLFIDIATLSSALISPFFILLAPFSLLLVAKHRANLLTLLLVPLFSYWLSPPSEGRYVISVLPLFATLILSVIHKNTALLKIIQICFIATILLSTATRTISLYNHLQTFSGSQYLTTLTTPHNQTLLERYYSAYYTTFTYY